jgi:hypothetical protein
VWCLVRENSGAVGGDENIVFEPDTPDFEKRLDSLPDEMGFEPAVPSVGRKSVRNEVQPWFDGHHESLAKWQIDSNPRSATEAIETSRLSATDVANAQADHVADTVGEKRCDHTRFRQILWLTAKQSKANKVPCDAHGRRPVDLVPLHAGLAGCNRRELSIPHNPDQIGLPRIKTAAGVKHSCDINTVILNLGTSINQNQLVWADATPSGESMQDG